MYRPEVGEECEYHLDGSSLWFKCTVKYIVNNQGYVLEIPHIGGESYASINGQDKIEFRPLKSKRDEEIDEMVDVVFNHGGESSVGAFCQKIYDAGYRKQMPYSEFVSKIQDYLSKYEEYDSAALSIARGIASKLGYTPEEN
jgi:hypothetical protein